MKPRYKTFVGVMNYRLKNAQGHTAPRVERHTRHCLGMLTFDEVIRAQVRLTKFIDDHRQVIVYSPDFERMTVRKINGRWKPQR